MGGEVGGSLSSSRVTVLDGKTDGGSGGGCVGRHVRRRVEWW